MARLTALLCAVLFCLFTPGKTQLPAWNKTLSDLLEGQNTTEGQNTVQDIYKALTTLNFASIFESQIVNSLRGTNGKLGQCGLDLQRISNSSEMIQYFDAAGKPPSGILRGNTNWAPSVEQCRAIPNSHICGSSFTVSVPSMSLVIPVITWSGCFPHSCKADNVTAIVRAVLSQAPTLTNSRVHLTVHGSLCLAKPSYNYTSGAIFTLFLCAVLLLSCLIGTIFDMVIHAYDAPEQNVSPSDQTNNVELQAVTPQVDDVLTHRNNSTSCLNPDVINVGPPRFFKSKFCEVFLCFSLIRNTKKIFNTNVPAVAITCINGIRVMSIWWVILGHAFLVLLLSPHVENKAQMIEDIRRLSIMPIINAYFAVDSFFFLSGLLVAYTVFRKMAKSDGKFNWVLFYVHRFWRLTPSYMFVILFVVNLKVHLSDTPTWRQYYKDPDPLCVDYWWTNLLYINNFHPKEMGEQCIGWSWYLANDMQFFVISPLMLILAFRYGWRGLAASAGTLLMISSIVTATLYGYYELDPIVNLKIFQRSPKIERNSRLHQNYIYIKPYCRIQPYLVGFILGYAMYMKYCGPKRRGWLIAVIGWSAAFAVAMTIVYAPHESIIPGNREWDMTENIFYGTLHRLLWGVVLAWVTYACHYSYGSLIQEFLSARFWIPLSRLTYSVYLIHLPVLDFMFLAVTGTTHYGINTVSYYFIAATVLSYAVGFILAVVIEFPSSVKLLLSNYGKFCCRRHGYRNPNKSTRNV